MGLGSVQPCGRGRRGTAWSLVVLSFALSTLKKLWLSILMTIPSLLTLAVGLTSLQARELPFEVFSLHLPLIAWRNLATSGEVDLVGGGAIGETHDREEAPRPTSDLVTTSNCGHQMS